MRLLIIPYKSILKRLKICDEEKDSEKRVSLPEKCQKEMEKEQNKILKLLYDYPKN